MVPKVLHIVLGLNTGGLERFVADLVRIQIEWARPEVLCLSPGDCRDEIRLEIPVMKWVAEWGIRPCLFFRIAKYLRDGRFDLVHTHNPSPHFYGSFAGLIAGVPVVHTKHGRNYPNKRKKVWLNRISTCCTNVVVAVSRDAEQVCREIEKVPDRKLKTVLNGIDVELFLPEQKNTLRLEIGCPESVPLVGLVARLSPEKNHGLLFSASKILLEKGISHRLVVVGDGPERLHLEKIVAKLGISSLVSFLGTRYDVAQLLPDFDVFVLSSKTEGISLTILEAMSCEVPVVATDVGGNPEVVVDGVTGFIVPQDPHILADRIEVLLNDASKRESMGRAGRQRVVEHFSIRRAAEQYRDIYWEILNQQRWRW